MSINYRQTLATKLADIEKLISTPNWIRDYVLSCLGSVALDTLVTMERKKVENLISSLENICDGSIKNNYITIYNQACVLAISSLNIVLEDYFENCVNTKWKDLDIKDDIKVKLKDLREKYNFTIKPALGRIILDNDNSVNFYDLQSTLRTYKKYFRKDIDLAAEDRNKIVFYQQCRHCIVHRNGIVDEEFLSRLNSGSNIKGYTNGDKIELNECDWENIKKSFSALIEEAVYKGTDF